MSVPEDKFTTVLVALMKGVVHREDDPVFWQAVVSLQARVREYVAMLGLQFMLDEGEGYGFLRQRVEDDASSVIPRLVARRPLSYPVSLLLVLLRKKLAESDAANGESRLILGRQDIIDLVRVFLPATSNDARQSDRVEHHIDKIVEMGFLRKLRGSEDQFEVLRIIKAFVDAQWMQDFEARLAAYRNHGSEAAPDEEGEHP